MTDPLPPLGLDDLRVAEPDRDSEVAFSPSETWWRACDAIVAGHKVADVAALLLELPSGDLVQLRDWWADVCLSDHERDATCPDLLLCGAIINAGWDWFLPSVDAATVLPLLDERARLRAVLSDLRAHINGAGLELHRMPPVDFRDGLAAWGAFIDEALQR